MSRRRETATRADEPVVLATYDSRHEAEMARGLLEDAGITAVIRPDDAGGMEPALAFQGRMPLWVAGDEAAPARALLSEAQLLRDIVPPVWAARSTGLSGPSLARDLVAMALLFGGVAFLLLDLFFRITGPSNSGVVAGATMMAVGAFLTFRAIAESRETKRRRG